MGRLSWKDPLLSAVIGAGLFCDVAVISDDRSTVQGIVQASQGGALLHPRPWAEPPQWPAILVFRKEGDGWTIDNPDETSWDVASRVLSGTVQHAAILRYECLRSYSGSLAPTESRTRESIHFFVSTLTPEEHLTVRKLYLEALAKTARGKEIAARLTPGDRDERTVLWGGYAKNLSFVVFASALIVSLHWVLYLPQKLEAIHTDRRLRARSHCPSCRYKLVTISPRCPECGTTVSPLADD